MIKKLVVVSMVAAALAVGCGGGKTKAPAASTPAQADVALPAVVEDVIEDVAPVVEEEAPASDDYGDGGFDFEGFGE